MTEKTKLKLDITYDDGLTTYTLIDPTVNANYCLNELLSINVYDGNFDIGEENSYHDKIKKFMNELIKEGKGLRNPK